MDLKVITLSSNASSKLYPDNKAEEFYVQLDGNGLDLEDNGGLYQWYAAMARLTFPKTWPANIDEDEDSRIFKITIYDKDLQWQSYSGKFPVGGHTSIQEMITHFNFALTQTVAAWSAAFKIERRNDNRLQLSLLTYDRKFLDTYREAELDFDKSILGILGFSFDESLRIKLPVNKPNTDQRALYYIEDKHAIGYRRPDLNAGQYLLLVHSDIINSTIVGDSKTSLLAVTSTSGEFGKHITFEPERLDFIPLQSTRIQRIGISIKNIYSKPVKFLRGETTITLHLQKFKRK